MKRGLVVYFSQTGQLRRVAESVCAPLALDSDVQLDWCALEPQQPYPFPWPIFKFFDQFPEAVHLVPPALKPLNLEAGARYDFVILAYTVWYLSPAPPVTAFLKSAQGRSLLKDTPVITIIACRNMWLMAQEKTRQLLADAGARLSDNIVLTDKGSALATFITTPRWMLTGRTDPLWGLFPRAGITDADIHAASRFGRAIGAALSEARLDGRRPVLAGLQAATADDRLIASERIGTRSFQIWGKLVRLCGPQGASQRKLVLAVYVVFLIAMIVTVVPVTMLLRALLRPLLARRLQQLKDRFEQPSGSGSERMADFGA
ncbi:MAG: dialkylresorcinol condensing enzyme [Stenotrophobium sp.]